MHSVYLVSALLIFGADPEPKTSNESVVAKTRTVDDLTVKDLTLQVARTTPRCLLFSEDGKAFYHLDKNNVVRRVNFDDLKEEVRLEVGKPCTGLSLSAEGLVVVNAQEVWLLDPKTLAIKQKIAAPKLQGVAAHPKLSFAYTGKDNGFGLVVLDLKAGKVAKEYNSRGFGQKVVAGFRVPLISPDGKNLFTVSVAETLQRYKIDGADVTLEQSSPRIAQGRVEGIDLSPDGKRICVACIPGNYPIDRSEEGPPGVYVFATDELSKPQMKLKPGGSMAAVGFDLKANLIYLQNTKKQLVIADDKGAIQKEYELAQGDGTRQFLIHPSGRKAILLGEKSTWYVELPKP